MQDSILVLDLCRVKFLRIKKMSTFVGYLIAMPSPTMPSHSPDNDVTNANQVVPGQDDKLSEVQTKNDKYEILFDV